jgi:diguanylate cyclase (GGDEF)-like protein
MAVPLARAEFPFLVRFQQVLSDLAFQTEHDPLTSLHNRRAFDRILARELERARRSGAALSLALFDLDDFKAVNDTHGHPCGDGVLTALAGTLLGQTRSYDVAARLGGEEFALIMPETGLAKARAIVERILAALRETAMACPGAAPFRVTCSVGLACRKGPGETGARELYALADKALYEAKALGKDRVETAPLADLRPPRRESLVASNEKKFLFTGS